MSSAPPIDLACPHPDGCPVLPVRDLDTRRHRIEEGRALFRCYDARWGYAQPNPGGEGTRFAPFDALETGQRVPTMYLAATDTAALLETVFHEVHHEASRIVYEVQLLGRLVAKVAVPDELDLVDLRDDELTRLGVRRGELVSSPAEHYPCTCRWAQRLHDGGAHGMIWHSRQAELAGKEPVEVLVVFCDRYGPGRGPWQLTPPGLRTLYDGAGRDRVDEIALELGAEVSA